MSLLHLPRHRAPSVVDPAFLAQPGVVWVDRREVVHSTSGASTRCCIPCDGGRLVSRSSLGAGPRYCPDCYPAERAA